VDVELAWQVAADLLDLHPQRAAAGCWHTLGQLAQLPQVVEVVCHAAGAAAYLILALLLGVDLLDHDQGNDDVVLFEGVERFRVVQEHVGIEHVGLGGIADRLNRHPLFAAELFRSGVFRPAL